jgi:hypothetical protein
MINRIATTKKNYPVRFLFCAARRTKKVAGGKADSISRSLWNRSENNLRPEGALAFRKIQFLSPLAGLIILYQTIQMLRASLTLAACNWLHSYCHFRAKKTKLLWVKKTSCIETKNLFCAFLCLFVDASVEL